MGEILSKNSASSRSFPVEYESSMGIKSPFSGMSPLLVLGLLLVLLSDVVEGQIMFVINTDPASGLIYFLLVLFFLYSFAVPIVKFLYVFYIERLVMKASKKFSEVTQRLSERLSDAGRKISEQARV